MKPIPVAILVFTNASLANAVSITNPSFEANWRGWNDTDPSSISGNANSGRRSAKISGSRGRVDQQVRFIANTDYRLTAYVKGKGRVGINTGSNVYDKSVKSSGWIKAEVMFNSGAATSGEIFAKYDGGTGRFDDFSLDEIGGSIPIPSPIPNPCSSLDKLAISSARDDGSNNGRHLPAGAIDGNLSANSRWSSKGDGKTIIFDLGNMKTVSEIRAAWYKGNQRTAFFDVGTSANNREWNRVLWNGQSQGTLGLESHDVTDTEARYVRIVGHGNSSSQWNSLIEAEIYGCEDGSAEPTPTPPIPTPPPGLDPNQPPSGNFDLAAWYVSIPVDNDNNGKADNIKENELNAGYEHPEFFYTAADGGMVFRCPIDGVRTSNNTRYTRVELREMLRRGDTRIRTKGVNKNNWVFGSAPLSDQRNAGGIDGNLKATLAVNQVTTSGDYSQVGRVIIGQIHANDDEPLRLYYRKLPENSLGAVYLAHQPKGREDLYIELIGSRSSSASDPVDGIALNEKFSYEIDVQGNTLTTTIIRAGKPDVSQVVDMNRSDYDAGGQYMYFKAGVYNQNNTGHDDDYVEATFYALEATHD